MSSELSPWEPRWPRTLAAAICILAALTLLWPLLTGQILFGGMRSDMFIAGYSFRLFRNEALDASRIRTTSSPFFPLVVGTLPPWMQSRKC